MSKSSFRANTKSAEMAEVEIDYIKKEIRSKNVHKPKNIFLRFLEISFNYFFFRYALWSFGISFIALTIIHGDIIELGYYSDQYFLMVTFGIYLTSISLMTLQHIINPRYADKLFAKMGASNGFKHKLIINNLDNKSLLLYPKDFGNIYLKYNLTEEYSKFLRNIKILKLNKNITGKKDQCKYWGIKFIFSKIPRRGELMLSYY